MAGREWACFGLVEEWAAGACRVAVNLGGKVAVLLVWDILVAAATSDMGRGAL